MSKDQIQYDVHDYEPVNKYIDEKVLKESFYIIPLSHKYRVLQKKL